MPTRASPSATAGEDNEQQHLETPLGDGRGDDLVVGLHVGHRLVAINRPNLALDILGQLLRIGRAAHGEIREVNRIQLRLRGWNIHAWCQSLLLCPHVEHH